MSEWSVGYTAAMHDLIALAHSRTLLTPEWRELFDDVLADALVIEREAANRLRRRRLRAGREAMLPLGMP